MKIVFKFKFYRISELKWKKANQPHFLRNHRLFIQLETKDRQLIKLLLINNFSLSWWKRKIKMPNYSEIRQDF